ncbi:hypothetical protein BLA29_005445 [Euroglyphus maynei]|uniref:Uncharacterized protein n=1 Tax=Euroglyphus maynei TaxID=6958 RepID=A0A1Y3BJM7_EURMA|nr:hypothetical protein BLA29_005445 [Euroglyphus maynei]
MYRLNTNNNHRNSIIYQGWKPSNIKNLMIEKQQQQQQQQQQHLTNKNEAMMYWTMNWIRYNRK